MSHSAHCPFYYQDAADAKEPGNEKGTYYRKELPTGEIYLVTVDITAAAGDSCDFKDTIIKGSDSMANPELLFVTGCNAAGKSSLIRSHMADFQDYQVIMTDVYKERSRQVFSECFQILPIFP